MKKQIWIWGVSIMLILSACNGNQSEQENVDKLLDRQTEIQKEQEESLDQLEELKDSLAAERKSLLDQREIKDQQIQQMEENQKTLAEKLKEEEAKAVSSQRAELEDQLKVYEDTIALLKSELGHLNERLDSITNNLEIYTAQEVRAEKRLESGIVEIDERMTTRENRKQQEIKRIDLLRKQIQIADKKTEAYELEREMYVDERNEMLRKNKPEDEIALFEARIAQMDSTIAVETRHRKELENNIRNAEAFIAETDDLMSELQAQIKEEYDRKEIIESFISSEKERLSRELEQLQNTRRALLQEQEDISGNLARTEIQISRLNRDVELIKSKKMSDILELQANIEQSDADLSQEEIDLLEESTVAPITSLSGQDATNEELIMLFNLGNQLDSLNKLIQSEKTEIAKTRMVLSEKRAEAAAKRAQFGRAVGIVGIVVILGGIALLAFFYYLGKRSRKS